MSDLFTEFAAMYILEPKEHKNPGGDSSTATHSINTVQQNLPLIPNLRSTNVTLYITELVNN